MEVAAFHLVSNKCVQHGTLREGLVCLFSPPSLSPFDLPLFHFVSPVMSPVHIIIKDKWLQSSHVVLGSRDSSEYLLT